MDRGQDFSIDDLLLKAELPRKKYERRTVKKGVYWGQRKLQMSEIYFLTEFYLPIISDNPRLIYAGGAEGIHFNSLHQMFPELEMVLYDPRPFLVKPNDKISIRQEFFTDLIAEYWSEWSQLTGRPPIFISDIRSVDWSLQSAQETEEEVIMDHRAQERWLEIMNPVASELKFRLPYSGQGVSLEVDYLSGPVQIQPYAPLASTETRLIPFGKGFRQKWDALAYEEQLFHHNSVVREDVQYQDYAYNPPELTGSWDNTAEILILSNYLIKTGRPAQVEDIVKLSNQISQQLRGTINSHMTTRTSE